MSAPLRVAYARIAQETNALSPVRTTLDDFRRTHFLEGDRLREAVSRRGYEASGFMRNAELSGFIRGVEAVGGNDIATIPLFSAWAIPSGPLDATTFAALRDRLVSGLCRVGRIDGVFLSLHGAMGADGTEAPDAALVEAARDAVGPDVPVAVTLDLHANLNPSIVDGATVLAGYRTNPHRDHMRIGRRAGELLARTLLGRVRPVSAWRSLPMVLGGGTTVDLLPTMRPLFRRMRQMERDPRVLCASLFMCHPWNDSPRLGWSTHVTTDGDPDRAEALAEELAELAWDVRDVPPPSFPSASEAIATVRRSRLARALGTVCLCDASDVVGAGGTGENTRLLRALIEDGRGLLSYVPLRDPHAVDALWRLDAGADVSLEVGGRLDPAHNAALPIEGRLIRKQQTTAFGRIAVLELGDVRLVVTEGSALAMKPAFYEDVDLPVRRADAVVVKSFFPFRLFFAPYSRRTIYVRTSGITDFDAARGLPFADPVHPFQPVDDWRPIDRDRRGVA